VNARTLSQNVRSSVGISTPRRKTWKASQRRAAVEMRRQSPISNAVTQDDGKTPATDSGLRHITVETGLVTRWIPGSAMYRERGRAEKMQRE